MKSKQRKILGLLSILGITGILAISLVIGPARIRRAKADEETAMIVEAEADQAIIPDREKSPDESTGITGQEETAGTSTLESELMDETFGPDIEIMTGETTLPIETVTETEGLMETEEPTGSEAAQSELETVSEVKEETLDEMESDISASSKEGVLTMDELVQQLENRLEEQVGYIKSSLSMPKDPAIIYGEENLQDVMAVYAVRHGMLNGFPNEVEITSLEEQSDFISIYWSMNRVNGTIQEINGQSVYTINVVRDSYHNYPLTEEQNAQLVTIIER